MMATESKMLRSAAVLAACAIITASAYAAGEPKGDVYTLSTCIVSGKPLGDAPVVKTIQGREMRFCCGGCPAKVEADPATFMAKLDEKLIASQKAAYPVDTCAVTKESIDPKKPADIVYKNRLVRFCCIDCKKEFDADPAKYLAEIDKAVIEKQGPGYTSKTCVVSGKELSANAVNYVVANQLVKFCCNDCVKEFEKDPSKYLSMVDGDSGKHAEEKGHEKKN